MRRVRPPVQRSLGELPKLPERVRPLGEQEEPQRLEAHPEVLPAALRVRPCDIPPHSQAILHTYCTSAARVLQTQRPALPLTTSLN